ncbi:MAG TPA: tetratricopeptide repeat protein, partial [Methanotrichaceae archaeon]|nr:tetratricopeptide repeat protein [Methanotrichaceae archaeon]
LLEIDPVNTEAWKTKGYDLIALGNYDQAESCYSRAIEINPLDLSAWYSKGLIYMRHIISQNLNPSSNKLKSWDAASYNP